MFTLKSCQNRLTNLQNAVSLVRNLLVMLVGVMWFVMEANLYTFPLHVFFPIALQTCFVKANYDNLE